MIHWPDWWYWELELSPHLLKRMEDRRFNETDLRRMMEDATHIHENHEPGRYVVDTAHGNRRWEIIVEPEHQDRLLVVVTAYSIG